MSEEVKAPETAAAPAAAPAKPKKPLPKSRVMLNALVQSIYDDAWAAEAAGEPVGWSTSIFPQELCATFGVPVLYPENNAAGVAARHHSPRFIATAEGELGYSSDICSYARLSIGMAHQMVNDPNYVPEETQRMPRPTFLLCATNSCYELLKWYECLSRELNIPIFMQDCLFNYYEDKPAAHWKKYGASQILHNISRMEEFFGKKFDWDKFLEIQKISTLNAKLFDECVLMNDRCPSPLNGFDLFNYMAPMVVARGRKETTDVLLQLKAEIQDHIDTNTTTFRGEEIYRVDWEGIACWPNLGYNLKTMTKYGINAVTNGYVGAWSLHYTPGDLESMAEQYMLSSTNVVSTNTMMGKRNDVAVHFGCDGMLCHINRSCKFMTYHMMVGREIVEERAGIPVVFFDGDQADPTIFNEAQFETRVQGLAEAMKANKEAQ